MTDPLPITRFRNLADAYGGAVAHWPEPERAAALGLAATAQGAAILAQASALDARLDAWRVPAPSDALSARITAGRPPERRRVSHRLRWWWSGVGIVAAMAGATAGVAAVAMVAPVDIGTGSTSFGDLPGLEG